MSYIDESEYEFNPTSRRYGASIDYDLLNFIIYRSPIAHYLTFGIVEEALMNGFNVLKNGEIDTELSDQINNAEYYDELLDTAVKILGTKRGLGWSVAIPFKDRKRDYPKIYVFDMGSKDAYAELTYHGISPVSVSYRLRYDLINNKDALSGVTKDFLFIIEEKKSIGQAKSYLYPIFDDLVGDLVLSQSTSLYLTRLGGGIKKMGVPLSFFDEDNLTLRKNTLANLESLGYNTNFIYPKDAPDGDYEFEIYTGTGTAMNIKEAQEFYLNRISIYTGIPRNKFIGGELGLRSGEVNYNYFSMQIHGIRRNLVKIIKWLLMQYAGIEIDDIEFIDASETRETEKIDILDKKIELIKKMLFLKIPKDQILNTIELDIDFDDTVLEQMQERFNSNSDENTDDENSDEEQNNDDSNFKDNE